MMDPGRKNKSDKLKSGLLMRQVITNAIADQSQGHDLTEIFNE